MKQGDYRRQHEGKKVKMRRMPPPSEMKMGTVRHEGPDEDDYNIIQCPSCENWVEESEIDKNGLCPYCPVEEE